MWETEDNHKSKWQWNKTERIAVKYMAIPLSVAKELLRRDMKKSEQQHKNACDTGEHRGVLLAQFTYIN